MGDEGAREQDGTLQERPQACPRTQGRNAVMRKESEWGEEKIPCNRAGGRCKRVIGGGGNSGSGVIR